MVKINTDSDNDACTDQTVIISIITHVSHNSYMNTCNYDI